jgi:1-acyl-sn-glycerol-3-phosphate acyltransferase
MKRELSDSKTAFVKAPARIASGVYVWTIVPILTVFFASMVILLSPFSILFEKQRNTLHRVATAWAKTIVFFNPWWTFVIHGKENLPEEGQPVVYVANHQSQADIISVFLLSRQFRWLAKASLFKIPFLGWAMTAAGYVPVNRGDRRSHVECMKKARDHLSKGTSMLFFPEGTRSKDGKLQDFKSGAFRLARDAKVPIIPITLQGADDLLPKGSLVPSVATVQITVHPAIDSHAEDEIHLINATRIVIASALPESVEFSKNQPAKKTILGFEERSLESTVPAELKT